MLHGTCFTAFENCLNPEIGPHKEFFLNVIFSLSLTTDFLAGFRHSHLMRFRLSRVILQVFSKGFAADMRVLDGFGGIFMLFGAWLVDCLQYWHFANTILWFFMNESKGGTCFVVLMMLEDSVLWSAHQKKDIVYDPSVVEADLFPRLFMFKSWLWFPFQLRSRLQSLLMVTRFQITFNQVIIGRPQQRRKKHTTSWLLKHAVEQNIQRRNSWLNEPEVGNHT